MRRVVIGVAGDQRRRKDADEQALKSVQGRYFDTVIPAVPLSKALSTFAQHEHLPLVYVSKIADDMRTQGYTGACHRE